MKLWFCREVFGFAATVVGHHVIIAYNGLIAKRYELTDVNRGY